MFITTRSVSIDGIQNTSSKNNFIILLGNSLFTAYNGIHSGVFRIPSRKQLKKKFKLVLPGTSSSNVHNTNRSAPTISIRTFECPLKLSIRLKTNHKSSKLFYIELKIEEKNANLKNINIKLF